MRYMIDRPTPFDSLETWERFLRDVRAIDGGGPEVADEATHAMSVIDQMKATIGKSRAN